MLDSCWNLQPLLTEVFELKQHFEHSQSQGFWIARDSFAGGLLLQYILNSTQTYGANWVFMLWEWVERVGCLHRS